MLAVLISSPLVLSCSQSSTESDSWVDLRKFTALSGHRTGSSSDLHSSAVTTRLSASPHTTTQMREGQLAAHSCCKLRFPPHPHLHPPVPGHCSCSLCSCTSPPKSLSDSKVMTAAEKKFGQLSNDSLMLLYDRAAHQDFNVKSTRSHPRRAQLERLVGCSLAYRLMVLVAL